MSTQKIRSASGDKRKYALPSPPRVIRSAEANVTRAPKPAGPAKK